MKVRPSAWLIALLLLAGCPKEETKSETESTAEEKKSSTPAAATTPGTTSSAAGGTTPTAPTAGATTAAPPPAGGSATDAANPQPAPQAGAIEPKVKAEVDNKPDGLADGNPLTLPSAKAMILSPKTWAPGPAGPILLAKSADDKARLTVNSFGTEGPASKIEETAKAAGLTGCQWNPQETVTAGKDKLTASVADGMCTHGTTKSRAAMMAVEGLLVIGSWEDGGDAASIFAALRSVKKASLTDPLAACCAALRQNAKSAPPQQIALYMAAASACDAARKSPQGVAAIRGALRGINVPSSCR